MNWFILLFLWFFGIGTQPVLSQEIAIVTSAHIPAFEESVRGFQSILSSSSSVTHYMVPKDVEEGRGLGQKIRASNAQLVYVVGLKATLLGKVEFPDIPVVFSSVYYPERYDLPANMYGVAMNVSIEEQFRHFLEVLPKLETLGVIYDRKKMDKVIASANQVASAQQLHLRSIPIDHFREVPTALRALLPTVDALWLLPDPVVASSDSLAFILETAVDHNVPLLGFSSGLVRHGALASVSGDAIRVGRQAGKLALSLLREEWTESDQKLVSATQPSLSLNLNTAALLGVAPSPLVLKRAEGLFGGPSAFAQHRPPEGFSPFTDSNQTVAIP